MGLTVEQRLAILEAEVRGLKAGTPIGSVVPVDLDHDKYANFTVRKSPPNWLSSGGHDYVGMSISETPPEFCEAMAEFLDWQASKDEAKNYSYTNAKGKQVFPAKFARLDAARSRAWAKRLRAEGRSSGRQLSIEPKDDADAIPF
jgi:hypothetical protein